MQQMRQQQPGGTRADDANPGTHDVTSSTLERAVHRNYVAKHKSGLADPRDQCIIPAAGEAVMPSSDELAAEFDMLMRRAGITVPVDRRDAVLAGYSDLRDQIALLHDRYAYTDEPANIFRLSPPRAS
jgi:hypothetical protein